MTLRNRTLGNASTTILGAALVWLAIVPRGVSAFPLEKFEHQLEVTCAADSSCARTVRAKTTLGAYTGIWVRGGDETRSKLSVSKGSLLVQVSGRPLSGIQLSWDSDTYADQLSSSGLKCIDMRHQDGSAIVMKDFKLQGVCGDEGADDSCPPFVVETRVYDAADPTGQTYSASILRRTNGRESQDLIIPFSNFNRKGLRGEGRLECAGAVSIYVRTDGYRDVTLSAGPIFTNSTEPFEALILTPTPTPVPPTPTILSGVSETPAHLPTISPVGGNGETPVSTERVMESPVPTSADRGPSVATPRVPAVSQVVVAPLNSPKPARGDDEETVYGAIVSE